ncbi:hypothetical protein [Streptomyces drozdowiczii]|uniref:hypothetical protein n=1 Tax=Streptomyces drozdowiczii TaxID=202862 RepID=UPI003D2F36C0
MSTLPCGSAVGVVLLAVGFGDAVAGSVGFALSDGLAEPPGFASSVGELLPAGAEGAADAPVAGCSLQPAVTPAIASTATTAAPRSA